jgi:hypothetical protein
MQPNHDECASSSTDELIAKYAPLIASYSEYCDVQPGSLGATLLRNSLRALVECPQVCDGVSDRNLVALAGVVADVVNAGEAMGYMPISSKTAADDLIDTAREKSIGLAAQWSSEAHPFALKCGETKNLLRTLFARFAESAETA